MFTRYKKTDGKVRVQILFLLLNGYDYSKVEEVAEKVYPNPSGAKYKKFFGVTDEFVDTQKIEEELKAVRVPRVCSPQSFDIYSTHQSIYSYRAAEKTKPLYINDMNVISPLMIITKDCIVTSSRADSIENAENKGFMYFVEYVLNKRFEIGKWKVAYDNNHFTVHYCSTDGNGNSHDELLYEATELDQTTTFQLVLYIIQKVAANFDEFPPDNFEEERWERTNE